MKNIKEDKVANFIKSENSSNIIRKAIVSDSKDVINKIDSLIKFTAYIIYNFIIHSLILKYIIYKINLIL